MTTQELQENIYYALKKKGLYLCFEVMMPRKFNASQAYANNERVDLLTLDTKGDWRFYELKVSVSDFNSKAQNTFYGNYNYYVMPVEIYEKVKHEIPCNIGCYVTNGGLCYSVKKAKRQKLQGNAESLKNAFIQALSRENSKLMDTKSFYGGGSVRYECTSI